MDSPRADYNWVRVNPLARPKTFSLLGLEAAISHLVGRHVVPGGNSSTYERYEDLG